MSQIIVHLATAGVAAAVWDKHGTILDATPRLRAWFSDELPRNICEATTLSADFASFVGVAVEVELPTIGRHVAIQIGRADSVFFGIFTDLEERRRLQRELDQKTAALEEKVIELSRSKRAILNILEDLEDRSRELSRRKEELEILNEDLQRINRELERANKELRTLDETKNNLLSNLSHELRTPLVAIKGYSDLMYRGTLGPLTEQQRHGLEISRKSQAQLIDLINNLLDFSRIEIGRLQLRVERFSVNELLPEVLSSVEPRASERGICIDMSRVQPQVYYVGDRGKVSQILTNLLTNAIKFNRDGGRVEVMAEDRVSEVVFSISDTGIGIDPEAIGRIFERFYQVDSSMSRRHGGIGIGLSIVKSLVELHGGSVQVFSKPGNGSTFLVRLPKLQDE